jgi:methylase of polypeptide subunit release factors
MDANSYLVTELIEAGLNRREARWLVEEFSPGDHESIEAMRAAAQRRLDGEPMQYVLGHWPFRSLTSTSIRGCSSHDPRPKNSSASPSMS